MVKSTEAGGAGVPVLPLEHAPKQDPAKMSALDKPIWDKNSFLSIMIDLTQRSFIRLTNACQNSIFKTYLSLNIDCRYSKIDDGLPFVTKCINV